MTKRLLTLFVALAIPAVCLAVPPGDEDSEVPLRNWAAPASWHPTDTKELEETRSSLASTEDDVANLGVAVSPLPFVPVTPCRIVNTRRASVGEFDAPALVALTERTFTLPNGPCMGLPSNVGAWSLNVTAVPAGIASIGGYVSVYPAGTARPVVSTLNFVGGASAPPVANAAIVPAGPNGAITVFPSDATHLLIDVNGYYGYSGATTVVAVSPILARTTTEATLQPGTSELLIVTTTVAGNETVYISLPVPIQLSGKAMRFRGVRLCYRTSNSQSYITSTFVRTLGDNLADSIVTSDTTDRSSTGGECYTVSAPSPVSSAGALTLILNLSLASTGHAITIGNVKVELDQE